ncbi:MAG: formate dehydrogenase beta subunit [Pseudomonadales bacterium]
MAKSMTAYVPADASAIALGADDIAQEIERYCEQEGVNLNIIRNGSRGLTWLEPLVEIDQGNGRTGFGPMSVADVEGVLRSVSEPGAQHELALGAVDELPLFAQQQRLTFARVGLIDPVSLDDYIANEGYVGLENALQVSAQDIVTSITDSGLRGRGGAAFPAGIKWQTVLNASSNSHPIGKGKYIVCNADEGDSGTFADRLLMEGDPFCLLEGMTIAGIATGAEQGYIYLRSEYPIAHEILLAAIEVARSRNYLGENICGSGKHFDIEVRLGAGAYICGEETSLLDSLEGKRGMVRAKPPLPALEGLFGQPTVVNNVITLASAPVIMAKGAGYYRDFGVGRSRGTLPVQLAGNIRQGGLFELPFGVSIKEIIFDYGGGTLSGRPAKAVQIGGPLGSYIPESDWETPLDYEALAEIGGMLGHGGIVVFDDSVDMLDQAQFAMQFCAVESCGKCTPCRIGSVRGVETLEKIRANEDRESNLILLEELCETMRDASLCAMGGLTPFPVTSAVQHFPEDFGGKNHA